MRICLVTPAPPRSRQGNRTTALRWAHLLRQLGHHVSLVTEYAAQPCDVLVALHARKSYPSVERYRRTLPHAPLIVALAGTDLYQDLPDSTEANAALKTANRVILLQAMGLRRLTPAVRKKTRVILQSATAAVNATPYTRHFVACVLSHLRPVKDPFQTALASQLAPESSRLRVLHAGAALEPAMAARARELEEQCPRYHWLGEQPPWRARQLLARSHVLVLTSLLEGGANVISEAMVAGVPVISSRMDGSVGLLGKDYPGYFPVGNTRALARLLQRVETDGPFYRLLRGWVRRRAAMFQPARERAAWRRLLTEVVT